MKAEQASSTAKLIAASTILLASDPHTTALVAPGARALCERFLSGNLADVLLAKSAVFAPTRGLWRMLEQVVLPGIITHYWHRKRWIERRCRAAIAEGCRRVVVIGAGFDTLALRLATEFPHIDWIEIDHPATQRAKSDALCGELAPNVRFVAIDLAADPLPAELFDDGRATLVIAEGVLMYLAPAVIDRLFHAIATLHGPSTRMVFSFMSKWPDGSTGFRPRSRWVERWLAFRSEPFAWSIEVQRIDSFLQRFELTPIEVVPSQELASEAGTSHTLLDGENLVLCEKR
ncbi:Putative S-adenosyl-L-methionine-dependent methyltransferase [Variovorax sp. PBS-H4]|uniref:class I SAM-dependent methyltransferase n=1 Tax=Variovorax sp. PBS-H4 TaxID=434008 RepID=UPI001317A7C8|nr:class I SAM-dependent methyltransferase [Variovorax sp. PBS-H4]VTU31129.1 Putative S-adenosyl-L-methionine-dependent methyltransferase [Variovorax sp. PBS-H4]